MNYYREKEGRTAAKIQRAVLGILCVLAMVFAACDTGTGSETTSDSGGTANRAVVGVILRDAATSKDITSVILIPDETLSVRAELTPTNASNKKVTWSSSDPLIASVDTTITTLENAVTAHKKGIVNITVTADGGQVATLVVDVRKVASFKVVDHKLWYDPNDPFELGDTKLSVMYDDDTINPELIPAKREWIEPYLVNTKWNVLSSPEQTKGASERHTLPIKYGDVMGSFEVTIRAMRWVTIVGTPARKIYNAGEPFDPKGLKLIASYDIGPNIDVEITPEILATAASVFKTNWEWNRSPVSHSIKNRKTVAGWPTGDGTTHPGVLYYDNGLSLIASEGVIGPLVYKGVETSETGINLTTLNGYDAIDGLTVAHYVARYKDANGVETYASADNLASILEVVKGKEATVTISDTVRSPSFLRTIVISGPSTKITLRGFKDRITFQLDRVVSGSSFTVTDGASLTLENINFTDHDWNTGILFNHTFPLIWVNGSGSSLTLGDSFLFNQERGVDYSSSGGIGTSLFFVESGTMTVEKGATIQLLSTGKTFTRASSNPTNTYIATCGIFVAPQGTLKMLGGTISGTSGIHSSGPGGNFQGVGDVVIGGSLELGGNAWIGRLALARVGPIGADAPVKINTDWVPSQPVILNLTANVVNPAGGDLTSTQLGTVIGYFKNKTLFSGKTDTTMANFTFATPKSSGSGNWSGGGFFANQDFVLGTDAKVQPTFIDPPSPTGTPTSGYALIDGVLVCYDK